MKIGKLFDHIGIKVICLLLAIIIWLYANKGVPIIGRQERERASVTFSAVPVQLADLPQGQWNLKPDKISLEAECTTIDISSVALMAVISLTQLDIAQKRVVITEENIKLPEGMKFIKAVPHQIEFSRPK